MDRKLAIPQELVSEIRDIMLTARSNVAHQVNSELLSAYWNIGRVIVEHEQDNNERAGYGKDTMRQLSRTLTKELGKGFSLSNVYNMRQFYLDYPKFQSLTGKLTWTHYCELMSISDRNRRSFSEDHKAFRSAVPGFLHVFPSAFPYGSQTHRSATDRWATS